MFNVSMMYYMRTCFDYELRNHVDLRIAELSDPDLDDLREDESDELRTLITVREYMQRRIAEMKV
jgi:hypothetical protein